MAIIKKENTFFLETKNTSYVFMIGNGYPLHLYYGERINQEDISHLLDLQIYSFCPIDKESNFQLNTIGLEYSGANSGDYRPTGVNIKDALGKIGCRLKYKDFSVTNGATPIEGLPYSRDYGECSSLKLVLCDEEKGLSLELFYSVFEDTDVITRHVKITNNSDLIYLQKASSFVLDFLQKREKFDLIKISGTVGLEFNVDRHNLSYGLQSFSSNKGFTSHATNPFFCLCNHNCDENSGEAYGFNLLYSGNFLVEICVDDLDKTRVVSCINPETFEWRLKKGESFTTPQAILTYSKNGLGGISRNFHQHINNCIVPKRFFDKKRPLVVNTWESFNIDVDEKKFLSLAAKAKELNIDTIVLDDGWFRKNVKSGLGEYRVDKDKFPDGLGALSTKIHNMKLNFGLWLEPEMISENSDLSKEHPEWIVNNGNSLSVWRNQFVLDFSNDSVVFFIISLIEKIFLETKPDYVKFDTNRYFSELGSASTENQGEVAHRFILGYYKMYDILTKKFPNILFESCAGGGGRFDAGIMFYTPQIWLSDNTDPFQASAIQYGASLGYPTSTMSCHFTQSGNGNDDFRYLVSSFGVYGYELDITKFANQEILKEFNARYLEDEKFTFLGELYRLENQGEYQAYIKVLPDKSKALFTFILLQIKQGIELAYIKLDGLEKNAMYKNSLNSLVLSGDILMKAGILISDLNCSHETNENRQLFYNQVKTVGGGVRILFEKVF